MSRIPSFKDLIVWQKSMALVAELYSVTRHYPEEERFGLTAETRKTARSVPYNIAEGKRKCTSREYHHGITIALGSLGELQTQVIIAQQANFITPATLSELEAKIEEIGKMLFALESALRA